MLLTDFTYHLPPELIAQQPVEPRDAARLLILDKSNGQMTHQHFGDLLRYLQAGDVLVFNDTRVIPARLVGYKHVTGGRVEVFLLKAHTDRQWEVLVKPGKKVPVGTVIEFGPELRCEVLASTSFGGRIVRFVCLGAFTPLLEKLGQVPLPPYIHEPLIDSERYQTIYARQAGSVAAPTAGLHFTARLLATLKNQGIKFAFVTLHIGLDTFRPVKVADITQHVMHQEYYFLGEDCIELISQAKATEKKIIAVGTTAIRTLETAARNGSLQAGSGWSDIFIYPGFKFQVIDAAITNFHLPQSTLLMLISALAGREHLLAAYQAAIAAKYRFFSFGDAMLVI